MRVGTQGAYMCVQEQQPRQQVQQYCTRTPFDVLNKFSPGTYSSIFLPFSSHSPCWRRAQGRAAPRNSQSSTSGRSRRRFFFFSSGLSSTGCGGMGVGAGVCASHGAISPHVHRAMGSITLEHCAHICMVCIYRSTRRTLHTSQLPTSPHRAPRHTSRGT